MKTKFTFLLCLFLLIAPACDTSLNVTLYTADVFDDSKALKTRATVTTEFSEDEEDQIIALLKENFTGAKNFRKEKVGYSEHLKFDYEMDIVDDQVKDKYVAKNLMTLVLTADSGGTIQLGVQLNKAKFDALNAQVSEDYYGDITMEDLKFRVDINNDMRDKIRITAKSCYINGEAIPFEKDFVLAKRDVVEVSFSEILKQSLLTGEVANFCVFAKAE